MFKWGDRVRVKLLSTGKDRQFSGAIGTIKSNPAPWKFGLIKQCPHKVLNEVFYSVELDNDFPIAGQKTKGRNFSFCGHELESYDDRPEFKLVENQKTIKTGDDIWKDFPGGKPF